jgi:MoxR-like ATPase
MKEISLEGKIVYLPEPEPDHLYQQKLIGREMEVRHILAAWSMKELLQMPLSPVLVSPPGLGKNRIIIECARLMKRPLYILQGHEDLGPDDLVTAVRFSDSAERKMDYLLSRLAAAMITGGICFLDEIGKIRARSLAPLASVLDERRYLDNALLGARIYAHPDFRFIAATNTSDVDADLLPDFIRSRLFPVIRLNHLDVEQTNAILAERFSIPEMDLVLDSFWEAWAAHKSTLPITPRHAIQVFLTAQGIASTEGRCGMDLLKTDDFTKAISLCWDL